MPKVKLKVSMIFGGSFHRFDTVMDREMIPPNLRKSRYLGDPREPDPTVAIEDTGLEELYDELNQIEPEPDEPEPEPEEEPEPPKSRFFKPKRKLR